jgi:hypothetical protein
MNRIKMNISMEKWWNDTYREKNSQCLFVHDKYYVACAGTENHLPRIEGGD